MANPNRMVAWAVLISGAVAGAAIVSTVRPRPGDEAARIVADSGREIPVVDIREPRGCCDYAIVRTPVATITDSTFPGGALTNVGEPFALRDGSYVVGVWGDLYYADRTGQIIKRIGTRGDGPGEYRFPQIVMDTGTEILVFDGPLKRITALQRHTFRLLRTSPLPLPEPPRGAVMSGSGNYLLFTNHQTPHPLHVVTPDGSIIRSFGSSNRPWPIESHRVYVADIATDTAIWLARSYEFRFEQWDSAGQLRRVVVTKPPPWFRPERRIAEGRYDGARIAAIRQDSRGYLWVVTSWGRMVPSGDDCAGCPAFVDGGSETWIEVFDLVNGSVIAAWHELGLSFQIRTPNSNLFKGFSRTDDRGEPMIDVFSFELVPRTGRK